jgi:hypothetical protein
MDGLALLCNLFADGPVTLERLRGARIASLGALERAAAEPLAECLHASVPQARAFLAEAHKLLGRLAEFEAPLRPTPAPATSSPTGARCTAEAGALAPPESDLGTRALRPGLLPGLDAEVCARLFQHHVRTVQALSEAAGLALARRTGIPYATLLELGRGARRSLAPAQAGAPATAEEAELAPFVLRPRRAPAERELARSDEFTLPHEPEAAGPFG